MKIALIYLIATVAFFAIDMLWLGLIAKSFYREKLGFIMSDKVNWPAAIIIYLIYIGGILFFAVLPALRGQEWMQSLINGVVLGLLCYATYDLTNMATIDRWPLSIVIVDILWGMFLTGTVSVITYLIGNRIG